MKGSLVAVMLAGCLAPQATGTWRSRFAERCGQGDGVRAMIAVGDATLRRRSELVTLLVEDVIRLPGGRGEGDGAPREE